jgi:hypothetical protein
MGSKKMILRILLLVAISWSMPLHAVDLTQNFNFDGYLLDGSGNPIAGPVAVKFQVYNSSGSCLLYEETHPTVMPNATDGSINLKIGSGTRNTGADGGKAYKLIFQNDAPVTGLGCGTFTPSAGEQRILRVTVGGTLLTPDYAMSAVPMATVAESLQGKVPADFISAKPYALPATDGTANQVLKTDGAGVVSWTTPAGGGITSLNGSGSASQTFSTGFASTAPQFTTSGSVHSLDIPMASTVGAGAGLISHSEYNIFNGKMDVTGASMTGSLFLNADPSSAMGAATKQYVDNNTITKLPMAGGTMTGSLILNANPVLPLEAATKDYVDTAVTGATGISSLNGLTVSAQSFSMGTTGTSPGMSSSGSVHTLNIPMAATAGVTAGLLSYTDYTSFAGKLSGSLNSGYLMVGNAGNVATGVAMNGDATISNTGTITIGTGAITGAKILDSTITAADIAGGLPFLKTDGTNAMTAQLFAMTGPAATPGISFTGDNNTGITSNAADTLDFVTNGTKKMTVSPTGNVGMGTGAPSTNLDIFGTGPIVQARIADSGGLPAGFTVGISNNANYFGMGEPAHTAYINNANSASLIFMTNNMPQIILDGGGNLGVGTSSPVAKLDVNGNMNVMGPTSLGGGTPIVSVSNYYNMPAATYSPATVSAGTTATTTVSGLGGGISPAQNLSVSCHPTAVPAQPIIFSCYVTAAGVVTITLHNVGASMLGTPPPNWNITITKF